MINSGNYNNNSPDRSKAEADLTFCESTKAEREENIILVQPAYFMQIFTLTCYL